MVGWVKVSILVCSCKWEVMVNVLGCVYNLLFKIGWFKDNMCICSWWECFVIGVSLMWVVFCLYLSILKWVNDGLLLLWLIICFGWFG